jgi:hypothetical protein
MSVTWEPVGHSDFPSSLGLRHSSFLSFDVFGE